jgi:hypothetical protein
MPARFAETIAALTKGVEKMTANAAIKNIESWEQSVGELDDAGSKAILKDLGTLKKALGKDEPDSKEVRGLLAKLGKETMAISKKADGSVGKKLEELGQLLSNGTGKS